MTRLCDSTYHRLPMKLSGALDHFSFEESTPTIGREYFDVNLVNDVLDAENGNALVRDLAITSKSRKRSLKLQCLC